MKKQASFLTSLFIAGCFLSSAQIKSAIVSAELSSTDEHRAKSGINPLILLRFHETFPNASDETWVKARNSYVVSFTADGIFNRVYLNRKGKITSQIRYYQEQHLPAEVRRQVKMLNGCFTISSVLEITTALNTVYQVTINSESWVKIVQVTDDEMTILEEHKKE